MDPYVYSFRFCCDPDFNDQRELESLDRFVEEAAVDDVAVFCNVEEINTGHMTAAEQERYLKLLEEAVLEAVIQRALASGDKPFSCLTALLTLSMRQYLGRDEIFYSYSADTRDDIGAPGAPYNCVTSFQGRAAFGPDPRLEDFVGALDREVKSNLEPERKLERMAQQMNWIYEVSKLKAPLKIK